eukprot:1867882-Rhodomonas_salina.1
MAYGTTRGLVLRQRLYQCYERISTERASVPAPTGRTCRTSRASASTPSPNSSSPSPRSAFFSRSLCALQPSVQTPRLRLCAIPVSYTHLRAHETEADL